ncbi:MAG: DUF503 domain-containing protein [Acidobacteriota bacterium]|nr:DUF503 domain-containing protein [Acidobacteriota bacterium]
MVVAVAVYEFHLPGCRGLKEKRSFLRPLKTRLRGDFEISAAEVAHQDLLQRATLGIAAVGPDPEGLEPLLQRVRDFVEAYAEENGAEIASERHELVGFGDVCEPGGSFGSPG